MEYGVHREQYDALIEGLDGARVQLRASSVQ